MTHFPEIICSFLIATLPAGFDTDGNGRDREEARLDLKILRALNCNTSLPKKYIKDALKKLEATLTMSEEEGEEGRRRGGRLLL